MTLAEGSTVKFSKTVSESDVYLFAGITGDFARNHVDEHFMQGTRYGRRIVHGALLIGFMSRASTMMSGADSIDADQASLPVSAGFNRIRFIRPVFIGDTITVVYQIASVDERQAIAKVEIMNQSDEITVVAEHILRFV